MISTRGRYALRVMIDLAENCNGKYIAMKEVAARQEISLKYLERILPLLVKANLVEGVQGKGGGYKLVTTPDKIRVGEVLRLTEGDLAPVSCLEKGSPECEKRIECRTYPLWHGLDKVISDYLDEWYISDLVRRDIAKEN